MMCTNSAASFKILRKRNRQYIRNLYNPNDGLTGILNYDYTAAVPITSQWSSEWNADDTSFRTDFDFCRCKIRSISLETFWKNEQLEDTEQFGTEYLPCRTGAVCDGNLFRLDCQSYTVGFLVLPLATKNPSLHVDNSLSAFKQFNGADVWLVAKLFSPPSLSETGFVWQERLPEFTGEILQRCGVRHLECVFVQGCV